MVINNNIFVASLLACCFCGVLNAATDYCGKKTFNDENAVVQSPSYPQSKTKCYYLIDVSKKNRWVKLWFEEFNIDSNMPDCSGDFIEVSIGCGSKTQKVSKFCSRNMVTKPHMIFSRDGCISIIYQASSKSRGFKAKYKTYNSLEGYDDRQCLSDRNVYSKSGVVASPGWPQPYRRGQFPRDYQCEWDINVRDSTHVVKLNFMDVDLYRSGGYCRDKLRIKGEKSAITSKEDEWLFCSREYPFSITTDYYALEVEMDNSFRISTNTNRGFVVGWVAYENEIAKKNTKWGYVVGGIVLLIIACIVGFCCLRSYKQRQNNRPAQVITTTTTNPSSVQYGALNPDQPKPAYPVQPVYPPAQPAYPAAQPAYPAAQPAYLAAQPAYPAAQPAYPAAQPAYPPAQPAGYPPEQPAGYPPPQAGYPPPGQQGFPLVNNQAPPAYTPNATPYPSQ